MIILNHDVVKHSYRYLGYRTYIRKMEVPQPTLITVSPVKDSLPRQNSNE